MNFPFFLYIPDYIVQVSVLKLVFYDRYPVTLVKLSSLYKAFIISLITVYVFIGLMFIEELQNKPYMELSVWTVTQ